MRTPIPRRWNTGFIVYRWRHLFWSLPLIAILLGGGVEWSRYQRTIEARSVIQWRDSATISMSQLQALILSDAVLQEAALSAGYFPVWNSGSAADLRRTVRCEVIQGTDLLTISVKGRSTAAKVDLCNKLATLAGTKLAGLREQEVKRDEADLTALTQTMVEKRSRFLQHVVISPGTAETHFVPTPEYEVSKLEFDESVRALDEARNAYVAKRMRGVLSVFPVVILERAGLPVAFSMTELLEPASRASIWVAGGLLLAVLLAYVLEAIRPRPARGDFHGVKEIGVNLQSGSLDTPPTMSTTHNLGQNP